MSRIYLGGLGDVAGALPKALARRGHRVMVKFQKLFPRQDGHMVEYLFKSNL